MINLVPKIYYLYPDADSFNDFNVEDPGTGESITCWIVTGKHLNVL